METDFYFRHFHTADGIGIHIAMAFIWNFFLFQHTHYICLLFCFHVLPFLSSVFIHWIACLIAKRTV